MQFVKTNDIQQDGKIYDIHQSYLKPGNWLIHFNEVIPEMRIPMTCLGNTCNVVRGGVTGHDGFFILNSSDIKQWGIRPEYLAPMVPKNLHGAVQLSKNMTTEWLLNVSESEGDLAQTPDGRSVRKYLRTGNNLDVPKRGNDRTPRRIRDFPTVKKHKPYWYSLRLGEPAPILVSLIIDKRARILENVGGFHSTNRFAYITPHNLKYTNCLLAYLSSSYFALYQELNGPKSGYGALQMYTDAYKKSPVPDFENIDAEKVERMSSAWTNYRSDLDIAKLDCVVMEALGLNPDERNRVVEYCAELVEARLGAAK